MSNELLPCAECGMPCEPGEYHPYAACLMFRGCNDSSTVRANLPTPPTKEGQGQREFVPLDLNKSNIPGVQREPHVWGGEEVAPPSDVPAEPDHIPDAGKMVLEPSVVPMPDMTLINDRMIQGCRYQVFAYSEAQMEAYADARVAEATRELVDGLNLSANRLDRQGLEFPMGSPEYYQSNDWASEARALIAKYTQTQKESK